MRQPDDPEAITERREAFRRYLENLKPQPPRLKVRPLIQQDPTSEGIERIHRIMNRIRESK